MKRLRRFAGSLLGVAAALTVVLVVVILAAASIGHIKVLTVETASMRPAFAPGDALFMRPTHPESLRVGEIITYHSSRNPEQLVTHRIVRIGTNGFQTQGDALTAPDPAVRNTALAGEVVAAAPGLGRVLRWLQTWPGLICVVYVPASATLVYELRRMERSLNRLRLYRVENAVGGMIKA